MNARISKPQLDADALLPAMKLNEAQAIALAAMKKRDEAVGSWLRNAVIAAFRAVADYPARRRAYDELTSLSDRELADIGLTRADIPRVLRGEAVARGEAPVEVMAPAMTARPAANSNTQAQDRLAA